jgi:hypothetical protein
MLSGAEAPIPFSELVEITQASFTIAKAIVTGKTFSCARPDLVPDADWACLEASAS